MPRSPTNTTSVIPKRVLSVSTCAGTVSGSDVLPSNTCTAKGSPVPVVTKPITIWVLPAFLSRLYPKAASSLQAPSTYEEVTSYKITVGSAPPLPHRLAIERALKTLLLSGQAIQRRVEVIFVKGSETEGFRHSMLGRP